LDGPKYKTTARSIFHNKTGFAPETTAASAAQVGKARERTGSGSEWIAGDGEKK